MARKRTYKTVIGDIKEGDKLIHTGSMTKEKTTVTIYKIEAAGHDDTRMHLEDSDGTLWSVTLDDKITDFERAVDAAYWGAA